MALKLQVEDILGVYVIDESRIPDNDLFRPILQVSAKMDLYRDAENLPAYRYHYHLLHEQHEISIFEAGFISLDAQNHLLSFSIVHKYYWQITFATAEQAQWEYSDYTLNSPAEIEKLRIIKRRYAYLKNEVFYFIPIAKDIYGRDGDEIRRELRLIAQDYRENWDSGSRH